jgi:hypothetical protein
MQSLYNCNIGHWIALHSLVQPTLYKGEFQRDAYDARLQTISRPKPKVLN